MLQLKAIYADLDNFCALPEGCQAQCLRNPVSNHGYVRPGMEQFDSTKKVILPFPSEKAVLKNFKIIPITILFMYT